MHPQLYEQDYYLWLKETAESLQNKHFNQLDITNLVEELADMGRSEKQSVESNLVVLLLHLLKWKYQLQNRSNSWKGSIREHRRRLRVAFKDSPSLYSYYLEVFADCYQEARYQAADETNEPLGSFPTDSLFTPKVVMDVDYLPD